MPSAEDQIAAAPQELDDREKACMRSTEELVAAVCRGEKSAFAELVRLYQRAAIITAYSVLHDTGRAEDAAQEAFVIAYTKLNQLQSPAAFGPWLLQIVRRCATAIRSKRREETLNDEMSVAGVEPSNDWLQRYEEVVDQLARLPEHERTVVVLRYVNGQSVQDISSATGKPAGTIKKQLSRALARLRTRMKKATP